MSKKQPTTSGQSIHITANIMLEKKGCKHNPA